MLVFFGCLDRVPSTRNRVRHPRSEIRVRFSIRVARVPCDFWDLNGDLNLEIHKCDYSLLDFKLVPSYYHFQSRSAMILQLSTARQGCPTIQNQEALPVAFKGPS